MRRLVAPMLLAALAACGSNEPEPGGVSANEAAALDEAAAMVEGQRLYESGLRPPVTGPQAAAPAETAPAAK